MDHLLLLAVLVCPLVMGGVMVWMMRHMRGGPPGEPPDGGGSR